MPIFGKPRKYLNLFLVWFCTGLWHGASWNFIFWGLYFGIFIFIETLIGKKKLKKWNKIWTHIYSKLIIIVGFGIFYFTDLNELGRFFYNISGMPFIKTTAVKMFGVACSGNLGEKLAQTFPSAGQAIADSFNATFTDILTRNSLISNIFLIIFAILVSAPIIPKLKKLISDKVNNNLFFVSNMVSTAVCCALLILSSILLVDNTNNPFLYFRF